VQVIAVACAVLGRVDEVMGAFGGDGLNVAHAAASGTERCAIGVKSNLRIAFDMRAPGLRGRGRGFCWRVKGTGLQQLPRNLMAGFDYFLDKSPSSFLHKMAV